MEHAFTDRMVRDDKEDLTRAAKQYLLAYKGNFDPILHARAMVQEGLELNVAQVRMVLNVMRADTSIRMEYTPPERSNVIQFRPRGVTFDDFEDVPPPKKERRLELPVTCHIKRKFLFGMSTHKRAEVIHYIDHSKTRAVFKRAGAYSLVKTPTNRGWTQLWYDRIEIDYGWECGSKNPKVAFLTTEMAFAIINRELGRLCPTCLKIRTGDADDMDN